MGLLDFFKRKKTEDESVVDVPLEDLENLISEKKKELSIKEKEILNQIKDSKKVLIEDLEEKCLVLENIDLNQKKAAEKVKLIVKENLFYFISSLKKLTKGLNNLESSDFNKFIEQLNKQFFEFEKKSSINYEKATFLIGNELGAVKESLANFFRDLNKNLSDNVEIFKNIKTIQDIDNKLIESKESEKRIYEIEKNIQHFDEEITLLKEENESFDKILDKIKKSDSYKEEIDSEIVIHEKNQQYEKELLRLKEMIDFKILANFFHTNEKIMDKLKLYKNGFKETFESDSQTLIHLSKEAGIESDKVKQISDKINRMVKEKENIHSLKKDRKEEEIKKVLNLQSNIKENLTEIENFSNEKAKELKLQQKLDESKKKFIEDLKKDLIKLKINLIE